MFGAGSRVAGPSRSVREALRRCVLVGLLFALAYGQWPLYVSNQNTYFLHGLARAGVGLLHGDWMAHTSDPVPVFSWLVRGTHGIDDSLFYVFYAALLAAYACALVGIASDHLGFTRGGRLYWIFVVTFTLLHCAALDYVLHPVGSFFRDELFAGVAKQYVLGVGFQPSVFGVLLIVSINAFLRGRAFLATVLAAVAATVHSTYLLSAAALTIAYAGVTLFDERNPRRALGLAVLSLLLVLPIVVYDFATFFGVSQAVGEKGRAILVEYRLPHHAKPSEWFGVVSFVQIAAVVAACWLARTQRRLCFVLLVSLVVAGGLTLVQVATGSRFMALLFPWRLSAYLVPIASALLLGTAVRSFERLPSVQSSLSRIPSWSPLLLSGLLALLGIVITGVRIASPEDSGLASLIDHVRSHRRQNSLYMIPSKLDDFRLGAGVPVLADKKTHPYRPDEVVQWYERLELDKEFYAAEESSACGILRRITERYGVTDVVFRAGAAKRCPCLKTTYRSPAFSLARVTLKACSMK